ncbi:MAG TPA: hypothetical protein VKY62_13945 [Devosia sp.]|nr:hypothetical protein [Devosia sp.]HLV84866.1 hypothetical protein [Devosia sp.]
MELNMAGAVVQSAELGKALGANLTIVTATEPPPSFSSAEIGWSVRADNY